jgi:hypothetical protein
MYSIFRDLAIVILSAKFFGLAARKCKAPQVVGEILAGLLIGPCLLNLVQINDTISVFAEIGVDLHQIEQTRPNQQTGENFTDHLRGLALAGSQAKKLGAQNNNCQITEDGIHTCHLSQFTLIHLCYSTSVRFFQ